MALKYVKGNLVRDRAQFDVIGHQCNCFCNMGAGIAPQIKNAVPEAYVVDCKTQYGDKDKLGTISHTIEVVPTVVNLYGQYKYTRTDVDTNYDALKSSMEAMKEKFSGKKFGLPMLGAGLAGGNWNKISAIIEEVFDGEDMTIVVYEKNILELRRYNLI